MTQLDDAGGQELSPPSRRGVTAETFAGLRWSYASVVCSAAIQFGYVAAMSRLLEPAAFGLMAIATLALNFGLHLNRMGIAHALVQRPAITDLDVRATSTSGLVLGLVSASVLWLLAPLVGEGFFEQPASVPLLRVMALTFLLDGLGTTSQALLRREMRFRALGVVGVLSAGGGLLVGVGMALLGFGVWSLVGAALASSSLQFALRYGLTRHSVVPLLRWAPYRPLYGYGVRISMLRFMDYLGRSMDTFAIGRYAASAAVLGQYNRAYFLISLPVNRYIAQALTTVLFPSFSKVQGDPRRLAQAYLSVMRLGGMVLIPLCAGLAAAAPELVMVVLGDQWTAAIVLVPFFAAAVCLTVLTRIVELACEATADLNKMLLLQVGYLVVLGGLLSLAIGREAWAYAAALAAGELLRHLAFLLLGRRVLGASLRQQLQAFLPGAFGAVAVSASVMSSLALLRTLDAPAVVSLAAAIVLAAVMLAVAIRLNPVREVRADFRRRLSAAGVLGGGKVTRAVELVLGPDRRHRTEPPTTRTGG